MAKSDILHSDGDFYVIGTEKDFEIYRNSGTHAVRRAQIGKSLPNAWQRVLGEIERRKVNDPMFRVI